MGDPRIIRRPSDVAAILKFRRWELEYGQERVANDADKTVSRISAYECGRAHPGLWSLLRWADALGMDVALIPRSGDG